MYITDADVIKKIRHDAVCNACNGSGIYQINEPLQVGHCSRCDGTGKARIIQVVFNDYLVSKRYALLGLTSNGELVSIYFDESQVK